MQPPLPPEDVVQNLLTALLEWKGLTGRLLDLAGKQLKEILNPREDGVLNAILADKQQVYVAACATSERVVTLGSPSSLSSQPEHAWSRIQALRAEIGDALMELERVETRCREVLAERMAALRSELERCQQGARMHSAYAGPAPAASRFLDKRY
ncbi:MAG TPA: hypothetical protein VGM37_20785 [Armatimonadota bacterium]|jgi:hypothetical protein